MRFMMVSLLFYFPSLTFSSSVDNVENILDCGSAITIILENNIFTASSELPTYRRSYLKGNNFRGFRGFLPNPRKLIPAKNLFCPKPRKLVPAKLVKNFDPQK